MHGSDKVMEMSLPERTQDLREIARTLSEPRVLRGALLKLPQWEEPLKWSPEYLANSAPNVCTSFKIGEKSWLLDSSERVHFETECCYVDGDLSQFVSWLRGESSSQCKVYGNSSAHSTCAPEGDSEVSSAKRTKLSPECSSAPSEHPTDLSSYPPTQHWAYCDYKHMFQLFRAHPSLLSVVDWSPLGFEGRGGKQSTIWIGSELAHTPCHYDTYGYNIVAQLYGRKRWYLIAPSETDKMYPTRLPYEESSVFSPVNLLHPDYRLHPCFRGTTVRQVVMEPGDMLFIPKHWWHFVVCIDTAVSVNTWIELESDTQDRVREALVRIMVFSLKGCDPDTARWLNPKEEYSLMEDNIKFLENAIREEHGASNTQESPPKEKATDALLRILTQRDILDIIMHKLLHTTSKDK